MRCCFQLAAYLSDYHPGFRSVARSFAAMTSHVADELEQHEEERQRAARGGPGGAPRQATAGVLIAGMGKHVRCDRPSTSPPLGPASQHPCLVTVLLPCPCACCLLC